MKFVFPLLKLFFFDYLLKRKKEKKNDFSNFDNMVNRKKTLLKSKSIRPSYKKKTNNEEKKSIEKHYTEQLKLFKQNSDEENIKSTEKVIHLLKGINWGQAPEIKDIKNKFLIRWGINVQDQEIMKTLKEIISNNIILQRKSNNLPTYKEITDLIITFHFLKIFSKADIDKKKESKTMGMSFENIQISLFYIHLERADRSLSTILETKLKDVEVNIIQDLYISTDKRFFTKSSKILEKIKSYKRILQFVIKLPSLTDINSCIRVLELGDKKLDLQTLKKKYKKKAMDFHPDKIHSLNIPTRFEETSSYNFGIIKEAYEKLKNHLKDKNE